MLANDIFENYVLSNKYFYGPGYIESNLKSATPHFTSNEALLKCKGHLYLKVKLNLFKPKVFGALWTFWGNWTPPNIDSNNIDIGSNPKPSYISQQMKLSSSIKAM